MNRSIRPPAHARYWRGDRRVSAALAGPTCADINGFSAFTLNGGATSDGTTLTLTDGAGSEARSAFNNAVQNITSFTTAFTYTDVGGGGADGFAFVVQNDPRGTAALGGGGGAIGYGDPTHITNSAANVYNIYNGGTIGSGYSTNGGKEIGPTGPVNVASGNPIRVTLSYGGGPTLMETLTDTVTNEPASRSTRQHPRRGRRQHGVRRLHRRNGRRGVDADGQQLLVYAHDLGRPDGQAVERLGVQPGHRC